MPKGYSIILATDEKGGIGKSQCMAWVDKEDMRFFRKITTNTECLGKINAVIMGRKTWDSLPLRPLAGRLNIVISSNATQQKLPPIEEDLEYANEEDNNLPYPYPIFFNSIDDALVYCDAVSWIETTFVIGGAQIYNYCFTKAIDTLNNVYWTTIEGDFDCDTFFRPPPIFFEYFKENCDENDMRRKVFNRNVCMFNP